jgi:hypothetical protein
MMVWGGVFPLVNVLDVTPYVAFVPRGGAICANAGAQTSTNAANTARTGRADLLRGFMALPSRL